MHALVFFAVYDFFFWYHNFLNELVQDSCIEFLYVAVFLYKLSEELYVFFVGFYFGQQAFYLFFSAGQLRVFFVIYRTQRKVSVLTSLSLNYAVKFLNIGKGKKREEVGVLSLLPQQCVLFGLQWRTKGRLLVVQSLIDNICANPWNFEKMYAQSLWNRCLRLICM